MKSLILIQVLIALLLQGREIQDSSLPTAGSAPPASLPRLLYGSESGQATTVDFGKILPNASEAFTITLGTPKSGILSLAGTQISFLPSTANWRKDSATYTLCQNGGCGTGWLVFINNAPAALCTEVATRQLSVTLSGSEITILSPSQSGRIIEFSAENYTVDTIAGGKKLNYIPAGGNMYPWGYGYDIVRYKVLLANGNCQTGKIEFAINGGCFSSKLNDTIVLPASRILQLDTTYLRRNILGCNNLNNQTKLLLTERGTSRKATLFGTVIDTTIGGNRQLYYSQIAPNGGASDVFNFFLMNVRDSTFYKGEIIINP